MNGLRSAFRERSTAFGLYRAIISTKSLRALVRRTLAIALVGATYALIGAAMLRAYHEFGQQSLRSVPPLVLADRTPVKLLPGEARQEYTAARGRTRNPSSAALALGSGDPASPASRLLPATAPLAVDAHGITADTPASTERANASDAPAMGGGDRALPGGQVAPAMAPVVANARKSPADQVVSIERRATVPHWTRSVACRNAAALRRRAWLGRCNCADRSDRCAATRASAEASRAHSGYRGRDDSDIRCLGGRRPDSADRPDIRSAHAHAQADRGGLVGSIRHGVVAGRRPCCGQGRAR